MAKKARAKPTTPLGIVLDDLMTEARLNPAQLAKTSTLTRQTIYSVLRGKEPHATTLRMLAEGFAVHPQTGVIDEAATRVAWNRLMTAIGAPTTAPIHGAPSPSTTPPAPVAESIRHAFRDNAEKIEQFFLRAPRMTDHDRAFILSTVEWLSARLEAGRAFDETRAIRSGHATNDTSILTK